MSEQKPPNPGRRRFFGEFLSTLGREAGLAVREARLAAREIEEALSEGSGAQAQPTVVETPIHGDMDVTELADRLDIIDAERPALDDQVEQLVQAAAQPQGLAAEDRELLRRVVELLADRHSELTEKLPAPDDEKEDDQQKGEADDEATVLRRRREALRDWVWALITTLLGVDRLYDALFETFVSDELVPWAKEQWRGIFAEAEAAGVIEQSPLSSPLPSPSAEAPSPVETPTPKPETPTPPRRAARQEKTIHIVQPGETFSKIARIYDVSVASLLVYNGIDNPNRLSVGQQLHIPPVVVPIRSANIR